jgi:ribonuclease HI
LAKKVKYYVVWKGNKPGIYDSWEDCKLQIKNFPGAIYKSFKTKDEAIDAFNSNPISNVSKNATPIKKSNISKINKPILENSIAVDAACSGNPGIMEYRGVITASGKELFRQGPYEDGTNNIGEFLAIVHALGSLNRMGKDEILIYTDSKTAMAWVRNKKAKTTLQQTPRNQLLFELINRAEMWLKNNNYKNKIVKWETKSWGEIPADFGRK